MPSQQPNENMDKVLKAYAQKRRDDSGQMEMDLPTRNMLQAEVARKLAPVPVVAKARPRFAWWPQVIMGVAGCAAIAIALILWLPSQSASKAKMLAQKASSAPVAATPSPTATPPETAGPSATVAEATNPTTTLAVVAAGTAGVNAPKDAAPSYFSYDWKKDGADLPVGTNLSFGANSERFRSENDLALSYGGIDKEWAKFSDNSLSITNSAQLNSSALLLDDLGRSQSIASHARSSSVSTHEIVKNGSADSTSVPALNLPPPTVASAQPVAAPEARVLGGELAVNEVAKVNQMAKQFRQTNLRFTQIDNRAQYRQNLNSPPLPKVLTNFAVQRNGTNVSVLDSDGSVYNGKVVVYLDKGAGMRDRSLVDALNRGDQNGEIPEDNFAFSVSGYNRKLREKVVFTGNVTNAFIVTNGQFQNSMVQSAAQAQNAQNVNAPQQQTSPQNLLLNGRVQIGRRTEFEIQAAPTK